MAWMTDPVQHQRLPCRDPKAAGRWAILDPGRLLTRPQPGAAATGSGAVANAVETAGTTKRGEVSLEFTREAWQRLERSFERAVTDPENLDARTDMLLGAHLAGGAIEWSMLGEAHACSNPLTAQYGVTHGFAVGVLVPHVVRFDTSDDKAY